ncbi:TetR/AcrR family transcriptional regulator [Cupriavidus numazuensis]|uniref:TetR/AcrR family transcriptional regulator n=1 Tax=Cupriavidus numazuensis TaxID=221992 RepID=A0ABN7Q9B0_9BURK|nr:TetR/AcrR family transcriptional regulator [Cupriavidus numazuensis]CAG2159836.1 hypothetical protein LMG26411_07017 [Cupriavidus numazuensis]
MRRSQSSSNTPEPAEQTVVEKLADRKSQARTAEPRPGADSKSATRLLEVAERLFAQHGVELVPLRQIAAEAGQRNHSALHYYFGSREALVGQLLNWRLSHVNAVRHRYLDDLEADGKTPALKDVVRQSISALADTVLETPWGPDYLQVLAQATFSPQLFSLEAIDSASISAILRVRRLIAVALPDVPAKVLRDRYVWFNHSVVYAMAHWSRHDRLRNIKPPIANLVAYCAGGLSAAVEPATRSRTKRS